MGMLAWVMMGLALWHFTIWLPDRFWGGIVGAFVGALIGAVAVRPGSSTASRSRARHDTDLVTALEGIPGSADRTRGDLVRGRPARARDGHRARDGLTRRYRRSGPAPTVGRAPPPSNCSNSATPRHGLATIRAGLAWFRRAALIRCHHARGSSPSSRRMIRSSPRGRTWGFMRCPRRSRRRPGSSWRRTTCRPRSRSSASSASATCSAQVLVRRGLSRRRPLLARSWQPTERARAGRVRRDRARASR